MVRARKIPLVTAFFISAVTLGEDHQNQPAEGKQPAQFAAAPAHMLKL